MLLLLVKVNEGAGAGSVLALNEEGERKRERETHTGSFALDRQFLISALAGNNVEHRLGRDIQDAGTASQGHRMTSSDTE
jgi:hypothetical protein